jgi:hypothetical protein
VSSWLATDLKWDFNGNPLDLPLIEQVKKALKLTRIVFLTEMAIIIHE